MRNLTRRNLLKESVGKHILIENYIIRDIYVFLYEKDKEVNYMILFGILLVMLLVLLTVVVLAIGVGGAMVIIPFADVIVCIVLIILIIVKLFKRK